MGTEAAREHLRAIAAIAAGLSSQPEPRAADAVDLRRIQEGAAKLAGLRSIHAELRELLAAVSKLGGDAEAAHRANVKAAERILEDIRATEAGGGAGAGAGEAGAESGGGLGGAGWRLPGREAAPRAPPKAPRLPAPVTVCGGLSLNAIVLPPELSSLAAVEAAVETGGLFYVPAWRHFALKLDGLLLHGNVGDIYWGPPKKGATPSRVKDCSRKACADQGGAADGCSFYHDPAGFVSSTDVRSFIADTWGYSPGSEPLPRSRRHFGARERLVEDLAEIGRDEAELFVAQAMHDVLCALILWRNVLRPGAPGWRRP